jgi:exopolyphosphatase/guanosine-5'-triphosphate,3'-diphosphate pyrophosphatase
MRVLAFDLGSNTLRATVYDCVHDRFTDAYERIVKTADNLVKTGRINEAAQQRVIDAINEAKKKLYKEDMRIVAYATEALRRATNRDEVLERIATETGVRFRIIDGEKEALLTLEAVRRRLRKLHAQSERFVLVDIGGGSTELTFVCSNVRASRSFPLGIVTVAQRYENLQSVQKALSELTVPMRAFADAIISEHGACEHFVATAGTPTTVAAMKLGYTYETYDAEAINGTILHKEELRVYLEKLLAMPFEMREKTVGVGRSDLIAAGILIFEAIFDVVGAKRCIVIDDGLREGAALEGCGNK